MQVAKTLSTEEMMDRMARICRRRNCSLRTRPDFPSGPSKWYVVLSGVDVSFPNTGGSISSITGNCDSGSTPEEAVRNVWQGILALENDKECALRRYNCPDNVPIPGEDPQVWVRWNSQKDDWEDVPVSPSIVPPEKLRTYKDQLWRDKC